MKKFRDAKAEAVADFEVRYVTAALERYGSVSRAALHLGLDRANFRRILRRHGVASPQRRPPE